MSFLQGLCQWDEADVSQPGLRGTNQYWIQPSELAADLCDNKDLTDCVEHRAEQQQIYSVASVSQGCLAAAITYILIWIHRHMILVIYVWMSVSLCV